MFNSFHFSVFSFHSSPLFTLGAIVFFTLVCYVQGHTQAIDDYVIIKAIKVEGNKRTKEKIILREMDFGVGDTLRLVDLHKSLERNRNYIMNTSLFVLLDIDITAWDRETQEIELALRLKESWYIYPFPIFELADRNFNVWWSEEGRSFDRVNYGIRFVHLNTTGHRDPLKLQFHLGYTQKLELVYQFPPFNKSQTFGLIGEFFYARNREIAYQTIGNKLAFQRFEEDFPLQRFRTGVNFFYRPKIRSTFYGKLEYQKNTISDQVKLELNPDYFLGDAVSQQLMYLRLEYAYENRDIKPYPTKGNFFSTVFEKEGLGLFDERNGAYLTSTFGQYFRLNDRWSTETILKTKLALLRDLQPYNNYWALGYLDDFLTGYELYVIDGLDYFYTKTTLRFKLFDKRFNFGKYMPLDAFRDMPVRLYIVLNNDFGYVNSTQFNALNPLGNQMLYGGGLGLNMVLFYDKVIRLEYSFNHLWEKGLYLHYNLSF